MSIINLRYKDFKLRLTLSWVFLFFCNMVLSQPGALPAVAFLSKDKALNNTVDIQKVLISAFYFNDLEQFENLQNYDDMVNKNWFIIEDYIVCPLRGDYPGGPNSQIANGSIIQITISDTTPKDYVSARVSTKIYVKMKYRMSWDDIVYLNCLDSLYSGLFYYGDLESTNPLSEKRAEKYCHVECSTSSFVNQYHEEKLNLSCLENYKISLDSLELVIIKFESEIRK